MQENIYVMFDIGSGIALKPLMVERNDVAPIRVLSETARNEQSLVNKFPQDFQLVHVGTINLETLEVAGMPSRVVATGLEVLATKDSEPTE